MKKVRCFISFDYDNDLDLKELLVGQSKNSDSPFEIADWSIKYPSPGWRSEAESRIKASEVVIVICGKETDKATGVAIELEIAQDEDKGYFLLKGRKDGGNKKPTSAKPYDKMHDWTWENLKSLIHETG